MPFQEPRGTSTINSNSADSLTGTLDTLSPKIVHWSSESAPSKFNTPDPDIDMSSSKFPILVAFTSIMNESPGFTANVLSSTSPRTEFSAISQR